MSKNPYKFQKQTYQASLMIVDDNENNIIAFKEILKSFPANIIGASSGEECLKKIMCQDVFLILLDVNMPEMDGFELLSILNQDQETCHIPVIMITASSEYKQKVFKGYQLGAVDFMFKPVDPQILYSKVKVFVELHYQQMNLENEINQRKLAELKMAEHANKLNRLYKQHLELSTLDTLTSLPNRKYFLDSLNRLVLQSKRNPQKLALLFLDLDGFKDVNDVLGHDYGDELLVQVAEKLKNSIRGSDIMARLGGDEFTILIPNIKDSNEASDVASIILKKLSAPFIVNGESIHVGCSIGIALHPMDGDTPSLLMRNADTAMYNAKENGKNDFQFFTQSMHQKALEHQLLTNDLKHAWENGEFVLFYQPIVDMNAQIVSCEALLRWDRPNMGIQPPSLFIDNLERNSMIIPLGIWSLRKASYQLKIWNECYRKNLKVSVNISPKQFHAGVIIQQIREIKEQTGISADRLILEITESHVMQDPKKMAESLQEIKKFGINIAIDDFGTGYSSLSYLKTFPIDILKIDKCFIQDIAKDSSDRIIVESLIKLAHDLGLKVTAEGVEYKEQYELLKGMGCDYIQGFYFYTPVSAEAISEILIQNPAIAHNDAFKTNGASLPHQLNGPPDLRKF